MPTGTQPDAIVLHSPGIWAGPVLGHAQLSCAIIERLVGDAAADTARPQGQGAAEEQTGARRRRGGPNGPPLLVFELVTDSLDADRPATLYGRSLMRTSLHKPEVEDAHVAVVGVCFAARALRGSRCTCSPSVITQLPVLPTITAPTSCRRRTARRSHSLCRRA